MQNDKFYDIALSGIDGVGGQLFRVLINTFGTAKEVLETPKVKLLKVPHLGNKTLENFKDIDEILKTSEQILRKNEDLGIATLVFNDPLYPSRLKGIFDSPPILYTKGKGNIDHPRTVGIVGTRQASEYGKKSTDELVEKLQKANVQIVSGLAFGIDIAAHKAALKNGLSTIAVLANSLEGVYPEAHIKTARELQDNGLLVSEHPIGTLTKSKFFVARNRIIAGLSDVNIVVESAAKGGAMVTAEYANNYNKEVYAIPGGIFQKYSEGTNNLISSNKANILNNVDTLLENMNWAGDINEKPILKPKIQLDKYTQNESQILSLLMKNGDMLIDDISWQSQISLNKLASILLNLEFQDLIKQSPGKKFGIK